MSAPQAPAVDVAPLEAVRTLALSLLAELGHKNLSVSIATIFPDFWSFNARTKLGGSVVEAHGRTVHEAADKFIAAIRAMPVKVEWTEALLARTLGLECAS